MEEKITQEQSTINKIVCLTGVLGTLSTHNQADAAIEVTEKILDLVRKL